jgi:signal transduction histidine kinase
VTRMASATDKMARLLDETLELSRMGRVVNPPEDVALGGIVAEAMQLVEGKITHEGMQVDIAADMPVIFGDGPRLVEVLQNLIENAVKWTADQPDPRIIIGTRQDNGETVCYVRDNGKGIDPHHHEKIFGLFEKLDSKREGSGVGLALVKRIIEVHGGRIWVESEGVGQGSTFCFTLPQRSYSTELEEIAT